MTNRDFAIEIDTLRTDIGALRDDIGKLVGSASHLASAGLRDGAERARASAEGLLEKGRDGAELLGKQVEQHPIASLVAALGVGVVIGRMLDHHVDRR
ncbi:MAG: hypothetical protein H7840_13685 [Alphaproteobacteria bacterium]